MQKALFLLLSAAMLLCLHPAAAQQPNTLTGTVTDSASGKAVGYATVSLQRDSVTVVNAVAANSDGRFSLKAPETGDYQLCITMVGYTPYKQAVKVPASGKALGKIAITQGVEVGDVVIEVQKPLVMADAEKTTYSVEDDPQASTSTLDEIIRKVPQLSLDGDGNVLLNGQSNYKILLNGRNSATMSNNFKEVIQSMPASQISRIEVITNPSTKYEAEGVGGIINLITQRKKQFHGYNGSVSLNYEHTFDKEGHTLTISDEVEIDPDKGHTDRIYNDGYNYRALQDADNRMTGNTVQVDYANPLSEHHKIEAGLKHIYRNSTSDTDNKQSDEYGTFPIEKIKFTGMDYRQHVLGIYTGYGFTYTKWSGRLGARMERTWNDADVEETAKGTYSFSNRQFNVVPYLSLTFIPKVSHNISLSYTQRLQRPGIYMLSPAEDDTDPTRLSYGNPGLEAAVYHTINLQYGHYAAKWSMTFALNTFLSNNNMSSYSFSDGDGITNTTYSNDVRSRSYGFNGSFSYRPSEKVNLSLSYNGRYSQNDFDAMDIHTDQFTFSQNLNLDFALWKEARLMLGENYSTGYAWLGGKSESYYYYYMGIKQQFLKKKLDLSIMCNNPFEKYRRNRSTSDTPTFGGWSEYRYACRSLYFRVSYRFGKQNVGVKRTAKSIRNDDMSSGAQGGGGGSTGGAQGGGGM